MAEGKTSTRPNIIIILADDMGYSDIGCYGSEINTPNIDSLSAGGVNFTQTYNCARCCPSRASLLTGLYPHQAGIGHMVSDLGFPAYRGSLNDSCVTIAEVLKSAGYRTAMSGKWHVCNLAGKNGKRDYKTELDNPVTPKKRGFDRFYGTLKGGGNYFNPAGLILEDKIVDYRDKGYYYTDAITEYAADIIDEFSKEQDPFFLYVAYTAPHWPLHAKEEDISKYKGHYLRGWDRIRQNRHEELKGSGILDPGWEISKRDELAPLWEDIKEKDWEDRRMATYAAQIDCMDQGIGRIIARLKENRIDDNTIVMFLSDNGGCAEYLAKDPKIPAFKLFDCATKDGRHVSYGNDPLVMPGGEDTFQSYDLPWANVSNTPFKLFKHWVHEGGISTPFIISWPDRIKNKNIVHSPVHLIDIMATIIDITGSEYPKEYNGNTIIPYEGESFLPALLGRDWERDNPIFWEHEGNRAVRDRNLKLVNCYPSRWELYAMEADRTELNDLSGRYRSDIKRLGVLYDDWAKRCGVQPWLLPAIENIPYDIMLGYKREYWNV